MIRTRRKDPETVTVTFVLPEDELAGRTSVVGTFNGWTPGSHELRRRSNGTRSASVQVPSGTTVAFRYLGEDDRWFNDAAVPDCDQQGNNLLRV